LIGVLRALTLAVDGTQAGELHSVSRLNTEPLPSASRERYCPLLT